MRGGAVKRNPRVHTSANTSLRILPPEGGFQVTRSLVIHGTSSATRSSDGRCTQCNFLTNSFVDRCTGCGASFTARVTSAPATNVGQGGSSRYASKGPTESSLQSQRGELESARSGVSRASSQVSNSSSISVEQVVKLETLLGHDLPWSADMSRVMLTSEDIAKIHDKETLEFLAAMSPYLVKYFTMAGVREDEEEANVTSTFITAVDTVGKRHSVAVTKSRELVLPVLQPSLCDSPMPEEGFLDDCDTMSVITNDFGKGNRSDSVAMSESMCGTPSTKVSYDDGDDETASVNMGSVRSDIITAIAPLSKPKKKKFSAEELGMITDPSKPKELPRYMRGTKSQKDKAKVNPHQQVALSPEPPKLQEEAGEEEESAAMLKLKDILNEPAPAVQPKHYVLSAEEELRVQKILDDDRYGGEESAEVVLQENEGYAISKTDSDRMKEIDQKLAKLRPDWETLTSCGTTPRSLGLAGRTTRRTTNTTATTRNVGREIDYIAEMRHNREIQTALKDINEKLCAVHGANHVLHTPPFVFNAEYEKEADPDSWEWPADVPKIGQMELKKLLADACAEQNVEMPLDPEEEEALQAKQKKILFTREDCADYEYGEVDPS